VSLQGVRQAKPFRHQNRIHKKAEYGLRWRGDEDLTLDDYSIITQDRLLLRSAASAAIFRRSRRLSQNLAR
jgi:hypothetical protein